MAGEAQNPHLTLKMATNSTVGDFGREPTKDAFGTEERGDTTKMNPLGGVRKLRRTKSWQFAESAPIPSMGGSRTASWGRTTAGSLGKEDARRDPVSPRNTVFSGKLEKVSTSGTTSELRNATFRGAR